MRAAGGDAEFGSPKAGPAHVWIISGGKHYDAQHPGGVDDPAELTFFQDNPDLLEDGWKRSLDSPVQTPDERAAKTAAPAKPAADDAAGVADVVRQAAAVGASIGAALDADPIHQGGGYSGLKDVYDRVKADHPNLTVPQFKAAVLALHNDPASGFRLSGFGDRNPSSGYHPDFEVKTGAGGDGDPDHFATGIRRSRATARRQVRESRT